MEKGYHNSCILIKFPKIYCRSGLNGQRSMVNCAPHLTSGLDPPLHLRPLSSSSPSLPTDAASFSHRRRHILPRSTAATSSNRYACLSHSLSDTMKVIESKKVNKSTCQEVNKSQPTVLNTEMISPGLVGHIHLNQVFVFLYMKQFLISISLVS